MGMTTIAQTSGARQRLCSRRRNFVSVAGAFLVAMLSGSKLVLAATFTWNGGGGNVNFSTAGNWTGGAPTSNSATDLIFAGTTNVGTSGTPLNQNIANPMIVNSITFSNTAGSFFLDGNNFSVDSDPSILQSSSNAQSIANSFTAAGASNTTHPLTLDGNGTGLVTLSGTMLDGMGNRKIKVVKQGDSTFLLTGNSTYTAGTDINDGTLIVGHANALGTSGTITVASGATLAVQSGITFTRGVTFNSGAFFGGKGTYTPGGTFSVGSGVHLAPGINDIGTFTIGNNTTFGGNSVFDIEVNGANSDLLKVTGTLNTSSNTNTLALNMTSPTLGKYKIADFTIGINLGSNLASNGGFSTVTGLDPAYRLAVVTGANGEIDLIRKATIGTITATPAASAVITGGTTTFGFTVQNSAPVNSDSLAPTFIPVSNVTGSATSGTIAANSTSGTINGFSFNSSGAGIGAGKTGTFSVTDANATNSPQTGTVTVDVYDHAFGSVVGGSTLNFADVIVGYGSPVASSNTVTINNASGFRVNLKTTNNGPQSSLSITNIAALAPNSNGTISGSLATGKAAGSYSQNITLTYADDSALSGASSNLGTQAITLSGNVYDHASGSVGGTTLSIPNVIVGYGSPVASVGAINVSNASGLRVNLKTTDNGPLNSLSLSGVAAVTPGNSGSLTATLATGKSVGSYSQGFTLTYADDSVLSGASNNLGTQAITVSGNVLDHASASLSTNSVDFGNVLVGASVAPVGVDLQNASGNRADLVLTAVNGSGDTSTLTRSGASTGSVVAGGSLSSSIGLVTTTAGTFGANYAYDVEDQNLPGATDLTTQNLAVAAQLYAAASLTANTATTLNHGSSVSILNAVAAPLRATAYVDAFSISPNWTLNNLGIGSTIAPGAGTPTATVTFDDTGLLAGQTITGTLGITLENDQAITGAANQDLGVYNWNLSHTVVTSSGDATADVSNGGSYNGLNGMSDGSLGTDAALLGGSNTSGSPTTVSMMWRDRTGDEASGFAVSLPSGAVGLVSDVLELLGTDGTVFVLEMTIDVVHNAADDFYLAWLDGGEWKLAIEGNHGTNTTNPAWLNFAGTWQDSGAGLTVGAYGHTPTSVWAVLDHNSEFSALEEAEAQAVPEPSTLLLAGIGLTALVVVGVRRVKR